VNWYLGDGAPRSEAELATFRPIDRSYLDDPANYRPTAAARDAVNAALLLGMPLVISGEPGSGKTQLGYAVAHELGLGEPLLFVTKSTSQSRDLLYRYDAIRHFRASQVGEASSAAEFIELQPLGQAIQEALPAKSRFNLGRGDLPPAPRRRLIIVDEIDKAPRDFANDLLHEVDRLQFRIAELQTGESPPIDVAARPILFVTTNSEQLLPDAFLRRCAFVALTPPQGAELARMITSRFGGMLSADHKLVEDAVQLSDRLRASGQLERPPSSSELLQFLAAVLAAGGDAGRGLRDQPIALERFATLLGKQTADLGHIERELSTQP